MYAHYWLWLVSGHAENGKAASEMEWNHFIFFRVPLAPCTQLSYMDVVSRPEICNLAATGLLSPATIEVSAANRRANEIRRM
jgi:hypothetical protein